MPKGSKPGERRGGRKAGTPNKVTMITREEINRLADPVRYFVRMARGEPVEVRRVCDGASDTVEVIQCYPTLEQMTGAQRELMRLTMPAAKSAPVRLNLPPIRTANDVLEAHGTVIAAMSSGELTPDEAAIVSSVIENKRKAVETVDLAERLAAIERRLEEKEANRG